MINFYNSRKLANLTQEEVAKILGVAKNTISQWENGKRQPDYGTLYKLSNLYNVSIDELLGNERFLIGQIPNNAIIVPDEKKGTVQMLLNLPEFAFNLAKSYIEGVSATSRVL